MTESESTAGRYAWIVYAMVLASQIMALGFGMICIPPFLTTIAAELNLTSTQIGVAWGMIGLGALIFSIVGGLISFLLYGPNYYPNFFAQALVFAVIFLLVLWRLPETGSRAGIAGKSPGNQTDPLHG